LGLAAMKALYREKLAELSSLRRITHSTSLRATGSVMEPSTPVASSWRFLRTRSMACFTAVMSSGEVATVAAVPNGAVFRSRAVGFADAGAWSAGRAEDAFDEVGEAGTAAAAGARDSGVS